MVQVNKRQLPTRLEKIMAHHKRLKQCRVEENCYAIFEKAIADILLEILLLEKEESNVQKRELYEDAYFSLFHTFKREGKYIKRTQDCLKKDASPLIRTAYFQAVDKAICAVDISLLPLLSQRESFTDQKGNDADDLNGIGTNDGYTRTK